jgi:hypothetical protein
MESEEKKKEKAERVQWSHDPLPESGPKFPAEGKSPCRMTGGRRQRGAVFVRIIAEGRRGKNRM